MATITGYAFIKVVIDCDTGCDMDTFTKSLSCTLESNTASVNIVSAEVIDFTASSKKSIDPKEARCQNTNTETTEQDDVGKDCND